MKNIPLQIKSFNANRNPDYLNLKFRNMRGDSFRFFRATTNIFFDDISKHKFLYHAPAVWLCGDLHLENFGSYKGDNNLAYFGINDFDECILGSCLFDLMRILCCMNIASQNWQISRAESQALNKLFLDTYFKNLQQGYIKYIERDTAKGIMKTFLVQVAQRRRNDLIKRVTKTKKGKTKFKTDNLYTSPLSKKEKHDVIQAVNKWAKHTPNPAFYTIKDVAHRIAGCSSLGLKRYVVLVEGNGAENYLLDVKETTKSCLSKIIKVKQPHWQTEADRLIEVQQRMLADAPALLASINIGKTNFILKELQPAADRIDYTFFKNRQKKLKTIIADMAAIYAWGNLRSAGRQGSAHADEMIKFASRAVHLKKQLLALSASYSNTILTYYNAYCKAYDKGYFGKL